MVNPSVIAIREAISSGDFQEAERLWTGYMTRLHEELRQASPSQVSLSQKKLAEVHNLLEWSRRVVLCARSHAQDSLNSLHVAGQYGHALPPQLPQLIQTRF
jgi:hypothetical protein